MHPGWLLAIAVAVGAAVPLQSAVNARVGALQGHPLYGALANTMIATLVLALLALTLRLPAPSLKAAGPWWLWSGGLIGAAFVFGGLFVAPRVGAAPFAAATILGTLAASLLIDHFGVLGFTVRPLSVPRVAGVGCVLAGLLLLHFARD
ncbi:MAG: DMT family transporter [Rubrivivax sp.]|nr:DMT family transporter [Rubrivivax sp.]MCL4698390.1 DMT family transporter [Burkholderiaceae bacterium]